MKPILNTETKRVEFLDKRFYQSDSGEFYPSVTTVLDSYPKGPWFYQWLKDVGHNASIIRDRAAEEGTNVHDALEQIALGEEVFWQKPGGKARYKEIEWKMIQRGYQFFEQYAPQILHVEQTMVSDKWKVGGTGDLICRMGRQNWLIDYKTSNAISDTYNIQLAIYAKMAEEIFDIRIHNAAVLWLKASTRGMDKTGMPKPPKENVRDYDVKMKEYKKKYSQWKKDKFKRKIQGAGWQLIPVKFKDEKGIEHTGRKGWTKYMDIWKATRYLYDRVNPNDRPKNLSYPNSFKI